MLYAHTLPDRCQTEWEPLFTPFGEGVGKCSHQECDDCRRLAPDHGHLNKVAHLAAEFAAEMFSPGENREAARQWGRLAGLWHDLGKFALEWQTYLKSKADPHIAEVNETIDHATAGAQHAVAKGDPTAHFLAYAISGHHSGLLDAEAEGACLRKRLEKDIYGFADAPTAIIERSIPPIPKSIKDPALFTRMLFSCLVDADFLATEAFMDPNQAESRPSAYSRSILCKMVDLLAKKVAAFGAPDTPVNVARADVRADCLAAADSDAGLFSLTVPTGGGKTLSSLDFALRHAIRNGQSRIIYVIPFTSIIEQNAAVFEAVFAPLLERGNDPIVLQHHSNLSPEKETLRSRLAAENWDAPLVVTTAVQFYESLFADRTSKCRKLHRIANSVVILDEAQCLPVDYLKPCLGVLRELSSAYRTSVVLCTATQPAIHKSEIFPVGLEDVREIVSNPKSLYESLRRVRVTDRGALSDPELAAEMSDHSQSLAIVNTRKHAQALFRLLPEDGTNRHLSALMCPAHRQQVLRDVRKRLERGESVRLVSTQLIEAGVDVDFPVVYRSLAGIDSIAQAAGRCNRNGKLESGETYIFRSEHQRAETYFRETAQLAERVLELHGDDPLGLASVEKFFSLYYHGHKPSKGKSWDTKMICDDFKLAKDRELPVRFQFREAARKFRLIENAQLPILIAYDERAKELLKTLRNESIRLDRDLLRGLQAYTVQIYEREFRNNATQFESVRDDQFHILICPESHYSEKFGLDLGDDSLHSNPLICDS